MDWPKLKLDKISAGDKFSFKEEEASYYEDQYLRFDLVSLMALIFGPSIKEHPLISEYYGTNKII